MTGKESIMSLEKALRELPIRLIHVPTRQEGTPILMDEKADWSLHDDIANPNPYARAAEVELKVMARTSYEVGPMSTHMVDAHLNEIAWQLRRAVYDYIYGDILSDLEHLLGEAVAMLREVAPSQRNNLTVDICNLIDTIKGRRPVDPKRTPIMTRKDYLLLSETLKKSYVAAMVTGSERGVYRAISDLAIALKDDNPNFDDVRFVRDATAT
jgi:hypothetical protein